MVDGQVKWLNGSHRIPARQEEGSKRRHVMGFVCASAVLSAAWTREERPQQGLSQINPPI